MKKGQILIDAQPGMSSVALLEDGRLNEFYFEYKQTNRLTGNIYKGKVVNVLQGLQTAFVNFGLNRNGFLYVGETLEDRADLKKSGVIPSELSVQEGDMVMVQVTKEEVGQKGARLSMNLSLPGRTIVYLPNIDFVGISNKITDPDLREKLMKLLEKHKPVGGGLIARTICLEAKKSDIVAEIKRMQILYQNICKQYDGADGIALVHSEGDLIFRTVRDMISSNIDSIICNDFGTVGRLKARFHELRSDFENKIHYFKSDYDIWDVYGIDGEVDKLLERKVMLPSGGSLVIDRTEALTAIDVNTGRYTGSGNHEDTVFLTNQEAACEIARQIRLRNIGGIIVVDFIDMIEDEHKTQVVETLRAESVMDRTKTRVQEMSPLGLVEMTRKKVGNELTAILTDGCPFCQGGRMPGSAYVARKLMSALKRLFAERDYSGALVRIGGDAINHIFSSRCFGAVCETVWKDKRIYLIPTATLTPLKFSVTGTDDVSITLPMGAKLLY